MEIGASLATQMAYYQGDDGEIVADNEWIVCGFNGAVPEYVKYLTDLDRFFVKATDDDNAERVIEAGDPVYVRGWDDSTHDYVYSKVGAVAGMEGEFKYGDTNTDYGTASIKDPYAVPANLVVALDDGRTKTAWFAGHNMQLWSRYQFLDCDVAGSLAVAEEMMNDSTQWTAFHLFDSTSWKHVSWKDVDVRKYMNNIRYTRFECHYYPHGSTWAGSASDKMHTPVKHSFLQKILVNSDAFLENVASQANRSWYSDDETHHTVDRFWLPDCGLLRSAAYTNGAEKYGEDYKDCIIGLCEEQGFVDCMYKTFINGARGAGGNYLRSKYASGGTVYAVAGDKIYNAAPGGWYRNNGFAPACTIG